MKKILSIAVFLFITAAVFGQAQKGTVILGGTAGINNTSSDGAGFLIVNISPLLGYFVSNNVAIGGNLDFTLVASDGDSESAIGISPFARFYFTSAGKNRFFAQPKVGITASGGSTSLLFGLGVGADFFLNDFIAIEAILGYQRTQYPEFEFGTNTIGLNFGVMAFLNRNKE